MRSPNPLQEELLDALLNSRLPEFKELLGHPAVNPGYKYGKPHFCTCLEIACRHRGTEEFVKVLLTKVKPNINQIVPEPIHYAAGKGNQEVLAVLLKDKRIKINVEDSCGRTALHHVAKNFNDAESEGYEQCIAMLLARPDMDINRANKNGFTAIHESAFSKKAVEAFLKYGNSNLNLDSSRAHGRTARELILSKYPELRDKLPLPLCEETLDANPQMQLLKALKNKYLNVFRALLMQADSEGNAVMDPNYWYGSPYQTTCLEMACCEEGLEDFVSAVIEAGADPNMMNQITEQAPIHIAAAMGNHEALRVLLSHTFNVNIADKHGKTALHYAAERKEPWKEYEIKKIKCLQQLLKRLDLQINIKDENNSPAIYKAVLCGNRAGVKEMLLQKLHKLDLDYFRGIENQSLRTIIEETFPELKIYLPEPEVVNDEGPDIVAVLFQHLYKKQEDEFSLLLKQSEKNQQLDLNRSDRFNTPLQYACRNGLAKAVDALLSRDIDPNSTCPENKCPPAILACSNRHYHILGSFLSKPNFKINETDMKGNSVLHYAVRHSQLESVICLLHKGSDVNLKNVLDKPPFGSKELEHLLDQCIKTNEKFIADEKYKVIFDYRLLTAMTSHESKDTAETCKGSDDVQVSVQNLLEQDDKVEVRRPNLEKLDVEMKFLCFVSQSRETRELLKHPIIASFLELKWERVRYTAYINTIFYTFFLLLLTLYILPIQPSNRSCYLECLFGLEFNKSCMAIKYSLGIFLIYLLTREIFQFTVSYRDYLCNKENILDVCIITLTGYIILFHAPLENEYRQIITISAILTSWLEMLLLTGRIPVFSRNVEMLKVVLRNYFSICSSYVIVILAFTLSFHTLFQDRCDFEKGTRLLCSNSSYCINIDKGKIFCNISDDSEQYSCNYSKTGIPLEYPLKCDSVSCKFIQNKTVMGLPVLCNPNNNTTGNNSLTCDYNETLIEGSQLLVCSANNTDEDSFSCKENEAGVLCRSTINSSYPFYCNRPKPNHGGRLPLACNETDKNNNPFPTLPMSFMKIIVMMTGELQQDDMKLDMLPVIGPLLFIIFVVLVAIVLLNLLIGLAVNDTQTIQNNAELLCLQTRVNVTFEIENIMTQFYNFLLLLGIPCRCFHQIVLFPTYREKKEGVMRPNVGATIQLSSREQSCTLKQKVLDGALKIINTHNHIKQTEVEDNHRLANVEESVSNILKIVETLRHNLCDEICNDKTQLSH